MKMLKRYASDMGWTKFALLLFGVGFFFGILLGIFCQDYYVQSFSDLNNTFFMNIGGASIDHIKLFQVILIKHYKSLLILFLISTTVLGLPYLACYLLIKGFHLGWLFAAFLIQYKLKGLCVCVLSLFPQYILFAPVMLLAVIKCYSLNRQLRSYSQNRKNTKKIIIEQLPFLLIAAVLLLIGSIMEAYLNTAIIQKVIPILF